MVLCLPARSRVLNETYRSSARRLLFYTVFFLFQAEDGIRDVAVTGVQTCALPICNGELSAVRSAKLRSCICVELISGIGRILPNKVIARAVLRVSARILSRYSFTPR